jgi:hypothetical protein
MNESTLSSRTFARFDINEKVVVLMVPFLQKIDIIPLVMQKTHHDAHPDSIS